MKLQQEYGTRLACEAVELAPSSYYYQGIESDDRRLKEAIREIAGAWPTYGYRRVTAQLKREGLVANSKRVRRLMGELGIKGKAPQRKRRTTDSRHAFPRFLNLVQELEVSRSDQVWVADITYIKLEKEFVYLAVLMDVYTRGIRGWNLGLDLDQELTMKALRAALRRGVPCIHHSDQGVQYAATAYVGALQKAGCQISMAEVGAPEQNGYAERLMRTIKEEEVELSEYRDYRDAKAQLKEFLEVVYMKKRIHSSLGYLTPSEFEALPRRRRKK